MEPTLQTTIASIKDLLEETGQQKLLKEWSRIYQLQSSSQFTVTIAGHFSSGKSTLLNKLLQIELLPVGDLPTTAILTQIMYGSPQTLKVTRPDKTQSILPFNLRSWDDFTTNTQEDKPDRMLHVSLEHDWLQQTDIHFIDTPGIDELSSKQSALVTDAIASSNGVLICISATMAMSLTEKAFIEQSARHYQIPHVAVIVTRLDQIQPEDRKTLLEHIRKKLKQWAPEAELFCAHEEPIVPKGHSLDATGSDAICERLNQWTQGTNQRHKRTFQITSQLQELLLILRQTLKLQKETLQLTSSQREEAQEKSELAFQKEQLIWEDLRLSMEQREFNVSKWLQKQLLSVEQDLSKSLNYRLSNHPDPKQWWEEDLPYLFRNESTELIKKAGDKLKGNILEDIMWFQSSLVKSLQWRHDFQDKAVKIEAEKLSPKTAFEGSEDLDQIRTVSRTSFGAITIASCVLFGPLATTIGLGGALVNEKLIHSRLKKQRKLLLETLEKRVPSIFEKVIETAQKQLRKVYEEIIQEAHEQEQLWSSVRKDALKQDFTSGLKEQTEKINFLDSALSRTEELLKQLSLTRNMK